ncbi:MAG: Maf family protein [Bacillota bacterium]
MKRYVLASSSPRRHALINLTGYPFETQAPEADETIGDYESHSGLIMEIAGRKVEAIQDVSDEDVVLGCDTLVMVDDDILGKPKDADEVRSMLKKLRGKTHRVITGCALKHAGETKQFYEEAHVNFSFLSDDEITEYIQTEEPYGKAGGYAVQGYGARFVNSIYGDYYAVMGLPVSRVYRELRNLE